MFYQRVKISSGHIVLVGKRRNLWLLMNVIVTTVATEVTEITPPIYLLLRSTAPWKKVKNVN